MSNSFVPPVIPFHSSAYKKFVGSFESQIRTGKTAVEMPALPIAPLHKSVMASSTGPYGGLCQLEADKDAPSHDPGLWSHHFITPSHDPSLWSHNVIALSHDPGL